MIRRFTLTLRSLALAVFAFAASLTGTMAGLPIAQEPITIDLAWLGGPLLTPADELRLQAAIAQETSTADSAAVLNRMLRDISIRTSLEDTARLHFELG